MRSPRWSVTIPDADCRSGRDRRPVPDGGQRRGRFTLEQRVALARLIWEAKGYETTARQQDGDTYVLAKNDRGTTELIRIAGKQPSSEAPLGTIQSLRKEYGFDMAYYFDPDRSLQPLETDVSVLDRRQIARIVTRLDLSVKSLPDSPPSAEPDPAERPPFEAYPPISSTESHLFAYVVGGFLLTLAASGIALGLVYSVVPSVGVLLTGLLLATGLSVWASYQLYRHVQSSQGWDPVLQIDEKGIHIRRRSRIRSIPWERIVGVSEETQTVTFQGHSREYDWLAIEVESFEGKKATNYFHQLVTMLTNLLLDTNGNYHRIRCNQYDADFEEIRAAVDRYSDAPVTERER